VYTNEGPTTQQITTDESTTVHSFQFTRVYWPTEVDVLVQLNGDQSTFASSDIRVTGYREPRLVSPQPDATTTGWTGDVKVDFAGAAPGYWDISVRDQDFDYHYSTQVHVGGNNPTHVIDFPTPREDGQYRIDISDSGGSHYWSTYHFRQAVPVRISDVTASRNELYSTVRDGFRDETRVRFDISRAARVTVRVRDADGKVRFARDLGSLTAGTHRFTWRGQRDDGTKLPVGRYRLSLHARTAAGADDEARLSLKVNSDTVPTRRTVSSRGTQTDHRSTAGNCYMDGYSGSLRLDCWGGRHAEATYSFRLPVGARKFDWTIRGEVWCCNTGQLVRSGRLVSARRYAVNVRVTNWRAYEVHRVSLTYTYDRRR
jgi:hypothetical protein